MAFPGGLFIVTMDVRIKMKKIFSILLACGIFLPCFADDTVIASNFDQFVPIRVPSRAAKKLKKRQLDIAGLEKMPQVRDWSIRWESLSENCRFYAGDPHWRVVTSEKLSIHSTNICRALTRNYSLKFEAASPADAESDQSAVAIGIEQYGGINRGDSILKEINIKRGEEISCDIPLRFDNGVPPFRILLTISGDVVLKKLALRALPDDLAGAGITVLEGTLKERSMLPDPRRSDYPDCRYTALLEGNSIIGGAPCPQKIQLVIDGFRNHRPLSPAALKSGDKVRCFITPFEKLSDEKKTVQQADDLNLYMLESYYASDIYAVNEFADNAFMPASGIFFSDGCREYVSIFKRDINPPIPPEFKAAQDLAVSRELLKVNGLLKGYDQKKIEDINNRFAEAWKLEKAKDPAGFNRLGNYVWRNVGNSFWCLPENYRRFLPETDTLSPETLECFSALKAVCESNGVQLMIAIVPNDDVISSRIINESFRNIPDIQMATYVKQLSEAGIEAVYTADAVIKDFNRYEFAYNYPLDYHPADTTQDIVVDLIAERLKRYRSKITLSPSMFKIVKHLPYRYRGNQEYRYPKNCDIGGHRAGEPYMNRKVLFNGKDVPKTKDATFMLVGNSFIQSPVHPSDTVPSLLSCKTLLPIDWRLFYSYSLFSEFLHQMLVDPDQFLSGRKALICYFGTKHLTYINQRSLMANIRLLDEECTLLSSKKMIGAIQFPSNIGDVDRKLTEDKISALKNETVIKINADGQWKFATTLENFTIDKSKPMICIVPCTSVDRAPVDLSVNAQSKRMRSATYVPKLYTLAFELPAGTREVSIAAGGRPGTFFVIKNLQIWQ